MYKRQELIGTDVQNLDQISFEVDFHGEKRVTPHPLTLKITTIEVVEQNVVIDILRDFIVVQPAPIWANIDISVNIETGMMASLTGATIKGEDSIDLTHRRTPFGETISIKAENLEPSATFTLSVIIEFVVPHAGQSIVG